MLGPHVQKVVAARTADDLKSQIEAGDVDIQGLAEYRDEKRRSVLHLVAGHGHAEVLRYLVESLRCEELINEQDEQGMVKIIYLYDHISTMHAHAIPFTTLGVQV
jgi:hypothetical protein